LAAALGEEGFKNITSSFFPECLGQALGEEVFFKKNEMTSPSVALREEG
jgi:hypothetical protein